MNKILAIAGGLTVAAAANATLFTYSGGAGTVPDNSPGGFKLTFNVTDDIIVKDVQVAFVGLNHTWVGDLWCTLTNVSTNTTAVLFDRVARTSTSSFGNSGDFLAANSYSWSSGGFFGSPVAMPTAGNVASGDYVSTFNATPGSSTGNSTVGLVNLAGQNALGTWSLFMADGAGGDTGGWQSVELRINGNAVPEPATMTALALGIGALAARRRRK